MERMSPALGRLATAQNGPHPCILEKCHGKEPRPSNGSACKERPLGALVKAGAAIEARDDDGWTPLLFAARFSREPRIVSTLLDAGADGRAVSNDGKTALDYARQNAALEDAAVLQRLAGTSP